MGGPRQRRAHVLVSNEDGVRPLRVNDARNTLVRALASTSLSPDRCPRASTVSARGHRSRGGGCASRTDSPVKQRGSHFRSCGELRRAKACFIVPGFEFGRPGRPVFPVFLSLSRGDGAPGGATGGSPPVGEPKSGVRRAPRQVPCYQGLPLRARWPNDVGPGASRRSNAMPLSGTAPCSLSERRRRRS